MSYHGPATFSFWPYNKILLKVLYDHKLQPRNCRIQNRPFPEDNRRCIILEKNVRKDQRIAISKAFTLTQKSIFQSRVSYLIYFFSYDPEKQIGFHYQLIMEQTQEKNIHAQTSKLFTQVQRGLNNRGHCHMRKGGAKV